MGTRSWDSSDWSTYSTTTASYKAAATVHEVFKSREIDPDLDPKNFLIRESRNSPANPNSTPIMIFLDVTGSMGRIAREIAQDGLGKIIQSIFSRKPVTDPHILFGAVGDVYYDSAPLQASQFEADIRILEQLSKIYVEGGGGGNSFESYNLPWHFANYHTSADSFEVDGRKGFIFTIGDEEPPKDLSQSDLDRVYGINGRSEILASNEDLLSQLSSKYNVYHLMIEEGSHMRYGKDAVVDKWTALLGQRAMLVSDYQKIPEIIVSTMQLVAGVDKDSIIKSWGGGTDLVIARALGAMTVETSPGTALKRY